MSTGTLRSALRRALLSCTLAAALAPCLSFAADWGIDQLLQSFARITSARASFVEKKYLSMLDQPVESSGELLYSAPGRLEKRTLAPRPEVMLVDGDSLVLEIGRKKHSIQLQDHPELAGFIDSLRGTMAGNRKMLERSFKLKLEGSPERWTLLLFPTDIQVSRNLHLVRISGSRNLISRIEIVQTDGDRSVMTIEKASVK